MKRWLNRSHLNRGGDIRSNEGYTILETMIVLAVTGAMFASIMVLFRGRQARVEFAQAVRDYEAMLQNITSDVTNGYYSSDGYKCGLDASNRPRLDTSGTVMTGSNSDCVFLGKILKPSGTNSEVYPLVGSRTGETGGDKFSLNAGFLIEAKEGAGGLYVANQLKDSHTNSFQLKIKKVVPVAYPSYNIELILFANHIRWNSGVDLGEGNSSVDVFAFRESFIDSTGFVDRDRLYYVGGVTSEYNFMAPSGGFLADKGVMFCLEGQDGQQAEIKLGSSDSSSSIFTTIDTKPTGADPCA